MSKTDGNFYSAAPGLPPRKFMDKRQVGTSAQRERPLLRLDEKEATQPGRDPADGGPSTQKHSYQNSNLPMIKSQ